MDNDFIKNILHELNIGEIYTSEQLSTFMKCNDVFVIFKGSNFNDFAKYKVEDCIEGYVHNHEGNNSPISLHSGSINLGEKKIYIVSLEK